MLVLPTLVCLFNRYQINPLQSKPEVVVPPHTYGVPIKDCASEISLFTFRLVCAALWLDEGCFDDEDPEDVEPEVDPFTLRTCPMRIRSVFKPFKLFNWFTVILYLFAIFQRLSPFTTLYVDDDDLLLELEPEDDLPLIESV